MLTAAVPPGLLAARQHDDRDLARGPALVFVVRGPYLGHQRPQSAALRAFRGARLHRHGFALDLDRRVAAGDQVLKPRGIGGRSALGGYDHPPLAIGSVDERRRPYLAGLPSLRAQKQNLSAPPVISALALRLAIDA